MTNRPMRIKKNWISDTIHSRLRLVFIWNKFIDFISSSFSNSILFKFKFILSLDFLGWINKKQKRDKKIFIFAHFSIIYWIRKDREWNQKLWIVKELLILDGSEWIFADHHHLNMSISTQQSTHRLQLIISNKHSRMSN